MLNKIYLYRTHLFLAHLSLKAYWWAYNIAMVHRPSVVVRPSVVHHFQRSSSPKPLSLSTPNLILSFSKMGERKFVRGVWVTWPRWPSRPYIVKNLQTSSSPGPKGQWPCGLVCSIGDSDPSSFVQMMTLGWPSPILQQCQIWSLMLLYGENC